MRMVKMTNNKKKPIVADFAPLGSAPCKEIAPGESVIVGPDSRQYLGLYMVMVRKGFTMTTVDDNAPIVVTQTKKEEPAVPTVENTPVEAVETKDDAVVEEASTNESETVTDETPVVDEKPKRSRKKSSPESDEKSGDSNE